MKLLLNSLALCISMGSIFYSRAMHNDDVVTKKQYEIGDSTNIICVINFMQKIVREGKTFSVSKLSAQGGIENWFGEELNLEPITLQLKDCNDYKTKLEPKIARSKWLELEAIFNKQEKK